MILGGSSLPGASSPPVAVATIPPETSASSVALPVAIPSFLPAHGSVDSVAPVCVGLRCELPAAQAEVLAGRPECMSAWQHC